MISQNLIMKTPHLIIILNNKSLFFEGANHIQIFISFTKTNNTTIITRDHNIIF